MSAGLWSCIKVARRRDRHLGLYRGIPGPLELEQAQRCDDDFSTSAVVTRLVELELAPIACATLRFNDPHKLDLALGRSHAKDDSNKIFNVSWQTKVYQNIQAPTGRFTPAGAPILASIRVTQGGYFLADALVRYAFTDKVSVGVNVTNLLDEKYYRNVGYFNGGYWGEPRRVLFNVRARY